MDIKKMIRSKTRNLLTVTSLLAISAFSFGQNSPKMRFEDKIRIQQAMNISNQFGESIWKGISKTPFIVLLVTDDTEFLINHPYPSDDFMLSEKDTVLKTNIFYRQRKFSNRLLATFPAINGVNCIVVGTPENTNMNSTKWIVTLLHEHFHQYQYTQEDYYKSVNELNLSSGDETGMWQLNYAFPYDKNEVVKQYQKYSSALSKALLNIENKEFKKCFKNYQRERKKFERLLDPADLRYFSFQIWQEGIARYTEYKFLLALYNYSPSNEMLKLEDFIPFNEFTQKFYKAEVKSIQQLKLAVDKRICFYALGFAEGLLLDKENPQWQGRYLSDKFRIEKLFHP